MVSEEKKPLSGITTRGNKQKLIITLEDGKAINWHAVALLIPGWNNKECRKRWVCSVEPSKSKGPWVEEEDTLLLKGVQIHGLKLVTALPFPLSSNLKLCDK